MLKILLLALSVLSCSQFIHAAEYRTDVIDRFDPNVKWQGVNIPGLMEGLETAGTLSIAETHPIETLDPYTSRIVDDIYYESLFAGDPLNKSERMYALVARAVRFDDKLKYVVFELNPTARFQDGTQIHGKDVLFSVGAFRQSTPERMNAYDNAVEKVSINDSEVRFDLKTTGQASRHALMMLASIKILKPNGQYPKMAAGVPIKYMGTGPYNLKWLTPNKVSFVRDNAWWGARIRSRIGLFNLRNIELINFGDAKWARLWLAQGKANYFLESHPRKASALMDTLQVQNPLLTVSTEKAPLQTGKPALAFNFKRSLAQDLRVRRAIMLAYDSRDLGTVDYQGHWLQPLHLADSSPFQVNSTPNAQVIKAMEVCPSLPKDAYGDFSNYGHTQAATLGDRRARLLMARKLLEEAGMTLEGGLLKWHGQDVELRVYAPELEKKALFYFEANLLRLGFQVYVGAKYEDPSSFDLYAQSLEFLAKDGHVFTDSLKLPDSPFTPCLNSLLQSIHNSSPDTDEFNSASEAVLRITEATQMFILTGQPSERYYAREENLNLPRSLSLENAHLYGYTTSDDILVSFGVPPNIPCADIGCLFRGSH